MMTIPLPRSRFRPLPPIAATLALGCLLPWFALTMVTRPLAPLVDHIAATGPVAVPLLVKLMSLAGTGALALAVRHLLIRLDAPQPDRAAALVLILPSAMISAGLPGQCDAIWAAPCIMALAAAVDRKHLAMLAWSGLAIGVNAEALLFAPFFVTLLINRQVPLRLWLAAPLVAVATTLLAWAAGWPALDLAIVPFRDAGSHPALSLNAPNVWQIVQALPWIDGWPLSGLALAAALGTTAAYIAWFSIRPLEGRSLLAPALLAPLITAGLLPHMHEGYFFLADVLALVIALTLRDKASWRVAAMIQVGSILGLLGYLSGLDAVATIGAIPMIAATIRVARPLVRPFANDNPLLVRA